MVHRSLASPAQLLHRHGRDHRAHGRADAHRLAPPRGAGRKRDADRRQTGNPDDVSFENFIAKLKVNEGKLKAQYNCRAVRFRVITKDGKVSLKPVPIFA